MFLLVIGATLAAIAALFFWDTLRSPRAAPSPSPPAATSAIDWQRYEFPTLFRRYMSSSIDGAFVLTGLVLIGMYAPGTGEWAGRYKASLFVFLLVWYEPVLTSHWCTLGQAITGIRVRRADDPEARISVLRALLRTFVKGFLGIISFFTMPFAKQYRAIHDMAANSVVIRTPTRGAP